MATATGAGLLSVVGDGSGTAHPTAVGDGLLSITGAATAFAYATGSGSGTLSITGAGSGAYVVTGTGAGLLSVIGAATAGHGISATGAGTLSIIGEGGDYPVAQGAGLLSIDGAASGYIGEASAGRWLYLHTTPPAQVYAIESLRGRLNPYLPRHQAEWSATDLRTEIGRTNDSWTAELSLASADLRARLATQAPFGLRVDLYDGGEIVRTGVTFGVDVQERSILLDVQSDVWTRDLPIRTSADLGVFRDVVSLPRRYGRSVTGELIPINRERTLFLWADHASLAVRSVSVDGQSYDGWSWRNDKDPNGLPITVVQTVDQIDDGVRIIATGDGALNATSGALIVNPADMARDLCRIAGLELPSSDFAVYRAECLARNLEVSGTVEGGSLQSAMLRIAESTYSAFIRRARGFLRLLPITDSAVATISADSVGRASCLTDDIATRLRVRYGFEETGPRRSLEVRAPSVEILRGQVLREIELPLIRDDRSAVDVAGRMLADMSRPTYRIQCSRQFREWDAGQIANVTVQQIGATGTALVESSSIGQGYSTPVLRMTLGAAPSVSLVTVAQAYTPEQYAGASVATQGNQRVITITDDTGNPIAGAQCTLDGSITRTSDGGGRVSFPVSAMPPGPHTIDVLAAGFNPFRLTVII